MSRSENLFQSVISYWARTSVLSRLGLGAVVMICFGLSGLTPDYIFGFEVVWPLMGLVAAAGWGRSGLAFGPLLLLVVFGFAQDISQAPWGSHGLANLLTFGFSALVFQTFDADRNPLLKLGLPMLCLTSGVLILWLTASMASGQLARLTSLLAPYLSSLLCLYLMLPLFSLGERHGLRSGVRG